MASYSQKQHFETPFNQKTPNSKPGSEVTFYKVIKNQEIITFLEYETRKIEPKWKNLF